MSERPLFGGAITGFLPEAFKDLSDVRPVPDHQEVWADFDTDTSVVIELLDRNEDVADAACARFFFDDVAQCNDAEQQSELKAVRALRAEEVPNIAPSAAAMWYGWGTQGVVKARERSGARNLIEVHLAALRLPPPVATDVVITWNRPLYIDPESSSAKSVGESGDVSAKLPAAEGPAAFGQLLASFTVRQWSLFGIH
mmetsp:Transcript_26566/g.87084  ORF Transcript_26566/g.87084 Transcript_26566/m.87084 type:complete len:198 (-) Transcript_26566:72-665(-)